MHRKAPARTMVPRAASLAFILLGILGLAFAATAAQAQPRFGDTAWVAPSAPDSGDPAAEGPRVADPDHERTWETVVRTPFRVAFLPLRLVARGMEKTADFAETFFPPGKVPTPPFEIRPGLRISPTMSYSGAAGPGFGVSLNAHNWRGPGSRLSVSGTWSVKDNRRARARATLGEKASLVSAAAEVLHDYRPNRRFYGVGNDAPAEKTIYLRRDNAAEGMVALGRNPYRRVRAVVGVSDIDIGPGYNGGTLDRAIEVFAPGDIPFLTRGSDVWSYGAGADFAFVDRTSDPSRGIHVRADGRRYESTDDTDLRYDGWRLESRGYLPVFASRRVVALRVAYQGADTRAGSADIPFYRLPESSLDNRFAAYSSGRFRDRRLLLGHLEYRWVLWERAWAVAFAQRGIVAGTPSRIRYDQMHESYGGGIRFRVGEMRTARLEAAKGSDGMKIYLDLKGDF